MNDFNFFIDFLAENKREIKKNTVNLYSIIALIVLLAILCTAAFNYIRLKRIQSDIAYSDSYLNSSENLSKLQEIDEISGEINQIQEDSQILINVNEQIKNNRSLIIKVLDFINDQVTEDMYFDSINIQNREVTIEGRALTRMQIAQFQYNVRNSGYFDAVFVDKISRSEIERIKGPNLGLTGRYAYAFSAFFVVKDSVYDSFDSQDTASGNLQQQVDVQENGEGVNE